MMSDGKTPNPFTRLEVIDETGWVYSRRNIIVDVHVQDGGQTLKVFVDGSPNRPARRDASPFLPGDIVITKAGGPRMTVESTGGFAGSVKCIWFNENKELESGWFEPNTLKPW